MAEVAPKTVQREISTEVAGVDAGAGASFPATVVRDRPSSSTAVAEALADEGRVGRYRVIRKIGRGRMGTVYSAMDDELGRPIALKVMPADVSAQIEERLGREAEALARVDHPNVVSVYSVERAHGRLFIAMELCEGQTLAQWHTVDRPWRERLDAYQQAGRGLAAAHARGLVHRDFNPSGCIIDAAGRVRVLGFGLVLEAPNSTEPRLQSGPEGEGTEDRRRRLTDSDLIVGSWATMPFEMFEGEVADARSDQFSFCVSLYEGLYGHRPHDASSAFEMILALEKERLRPPPPSSPIPARVRRVLLRGLALRREERWPSMTVLLDRLERAARPRRLYVVGGALAVGTAAVVVVAVAVWPSPVAPCAPSAERMAGVWDPSRRIDVERRLLATGVFHSGETWARLRPALDDYAEDWVVAHVQACGAYRDGKQSAELFDLRMRCLDGRRRALAALVDMLVEIDAETVDHVLSAADGLPSLSLCADEPHVRRQWSLPADPDERARVEALQDELARGHALEMAGRYADALAVIESVEEAARSLGHDPLGAMAMLRRGVLYTELGRYQDAVEPLERAYFEGRRLELSEEVMAAALQLAYVLGYRLGHAEQAERWLGHARVEIERVGDDARRARVLTIEAVLAATGGDLDQVEPLTRALALFEKARGAEHLSVATALKNLGTLHLQRADYQAAQLALSRALAIEEQALGENHPRISGTLGNLGAVYHSSGQSVLARSAFARALTLDERSLAPQHPRLARSLDYLGNAELTLGDLDSAQGHCRRALAIREQVLGDEHPDVAASALCMGLIALRRGEIDAALAHYRRSLAIREQSLGPDHPATVESLGAVGEVHLVAERFDAALEAHREALARTERSLGVDHARAVDYLEGVGRAQLGRQRPILAREAFERAVAIEERGNVAPDTVERTRFWLARARVAMGEEREPEVAKVRLVRERLAGSAADHGALLREIDAWLAAQTG